MSIVHASCGLPSSHDAHWSVAPIDGLIGSGVWCTGGASTVVLPDLPDIQHEAKSFRTDDSCDSPDWHRPHWVTKPHVSLPGSGVYCLGHAQPEDELDEVIEPETVAWCSIPEQHEAHVDSEPSADDPGTYCQGGARPVMKIRHRYPGMEAAMLNYCEQRGIDVPVYTNGRKGIEEAQELADAWEEGDRDHILQEIADLAIVAAVAARTQGTTVEECIALKTAKDAGRGPKVKAPETTEVFSWRPAFSDPLTRDDVLTILGDFGWSALTLMHPVQPYTMYYRNGVEIMMPNDESRGDYQSLLERAARLAVTSERTTPASGSRDRLVTALLADDWVCIDRQAGYDVFDKSGRPVRVPSIGAANYDEALALAVDESGVVAVL